MSEHARAELDALITEVSAQEERLQFTAFSNDDAWALGSLLRTLALERGHAVTIDIARGEQRLFHCALPGTAAHNDVWIERKKRTVREFGASSYLVGLRFPLVDAHVLELAPWMDPAQFSGHGGGFPLAIRGTGVVGSIAVSGLPHQHDHALIVDAIERHQGALMARDRTEQSVTYAAVGASQALDLMQYPPNGYRPMERRARIGHGAERWEYAVREVMTWGVQRGAGLRVHRLPTPDDLAATGYRPVEFTAQGEPLEPAVRELDAEYAATGTLLAHSGETVVLSVPIVGRLGIPAPARVVYVIDEPDRIGFAYGTLPGHPESGEEAFEVSRTDDGSVWLTVRAFSRPSAWWWWALYPALRLAQEAFTRRYLRALAGPISAQVA